MVVLATKAGIGFGVLLAVLGIVQIQYVVDPVLLFAAAGVVPGTSLVVPPDAALGLAAACLVLILMWLVHGFRAVRPAWSMLRYRSVYYAIRSHLALEAAVAKINVAMRLLFKTTV